MTAAATDFTQFQRMRVDADARDPAVLREVAGQFESLFLEILLKDMRSASLGDPIFGNNQQNEMYREMLDKQLAVEMSKDRGIGLADMLVRQLGGDTNSASAAVPSSAESFAVPPRTALTRLTAVSAVAQKPVVAQTPDVSEKVEWQEPLDFASDIWPHAERAGRRLGIAPESLLAQAALETGWGAHVIEHADGGNSLNLFGIKAGSDWDGASVARSTLEYEDGIANRQVARFRAYSDLESAFDDYAAFLSERPRYADVPNSGDDPARFGAALQQAGYATDPRYAQKIERIAVSDTLRDIVSTLKARAPRPINQLMSQAKDL